MLISSYRGISEAIILESHYVPLVLSLGFMSEISLLLWSPWHRHISLDCFFVGHKIDEEGAMHKVSELFFSSLWYHALE